MPKIFKSIFLILFLLFFCSTFVFAESITITTYYPSPYGSYNSLQAWMLGIGDNNGDGQLTVADVPIIQGDVWIRGKVGLGTTSPTYQLQLSTDSAAKPTANVWTIFSDQRIKKNIADFTDGLNIVMKLKPRTYQYNGLGGKGYDDTNTHIGFVAQEVEPVAPYMVETGKGTIAGVQVSDFKSYQGHALSFILVNAIQEQQNVIQAQQFEINGLRARLDKLERK